MSEMLLAPYVPLASTTSIGPWTLIPFGDVDGADAVPDDLHREVTRLVEAYRVSSVSAMGAVAHLAGELVGAAIDRADMSRLAHAVLAGVLANNPRMTVPEEEQEPNAGHSVATSENALLYGHPLAGIDSYVLETGVLARVMGMRYAPPDEPLPRVQPPVELPTPMFGGFDKEIADATYAALGAGDAAARRRHRTLDWYRIALSNSEAVTLDVRVGAARSALEVLTDAGDNTKRVVRSYGTLMRHPTTSETTYSDVFWAKGPVQLTPDEWWLTCLSMLRNKIVHGQNVPAELYDHDGYPQLNQIHDRLIAALQVIVADHADDSTLRLPSGKRVLARMADELERHVRALEDEADTDDADPV